MGQWQPGLPLKDPGCVPAASRTGRARYYCPGPRFEKLRVVVWEEGGTPRKRRSPRPEVSRLSEKRVYLLTGWGQFSRGEELGRGV